MSRKLQRVGDRLRSHGTDLGVYRTRFQLTVRGTDGVRREHGETGTASSLAPARCPGAQDDGNAVVLGEWRDVLLRRGRWTHGPRHARRTRAGAFRALRQA